MKKNEFNQKDEKTIRGVSKAIWIIAKIAKIFTIIGIVSLGLIMLIVPLFISKVEYKNNTITIANQKIVTFNSEEEKNGDIVNVKLEAKDEEIVKEKLEKFLGEKNKTKAIIYVEIIMVLLIASIVLLTIIFNYLEKLFKNISKDETPFTPDNHKYLTKISIVLIISFGLGIITNIIFELMLGTDTSMNISFVNILEILLVISMAYIFKYGIVLQEKSKLKMTAEVKE